MATLLARYLDSEGITQTEFARSAGIPTPMICQWLSGKRRPGLKNAFAIERATNGAIPASYWTTDAANDNQRAPKRVKRRRA